MSQLHIIIVGLFVLLLVSIVAWLLVYRKLDPQQPAAHPAYRVHQWLLLTIATLAILLTLLVVFSSDPGSTDDYLYWP